MKKKKEEKVLWYCLRVKLAFYSGNELRLIGYKGTISLQVTFLSII